MTEPEARPTPAPDCSEDVRVVHDQADANRAYLREKWGQAGLLQFEFADDTASDFESYDAVSPDRAAAPQRLTAA